MDAHMTARRWRLDPLGLDHLVRRLVRDVDEVIGPVDDAGVVRLRRVTGIADLAVGLADAQEAGTYRTERTGTPLRFALGPGPDSLKAVLHPPRSTVWTIRRRDGTASVELAGPTPVSRAVIGVRACDVRAAAILDRTQTAGPHPEPEFVARRDRLFVVAVDCTHPAPTCFCASAGGGPAVGPGADIALTELEPTPGSVVYVARAGSEAGVELLDEFAHECADDPIVQRAGEAIGRAERGMIRELPDGAASIVDVPDHPAWEAVAERCLTCGNCTAVCPTCFCTDLVDDISLDGASATRHRVWDTCFSEHYSTLAGRPHRASPTSRYRQWLTHKLGTWHEQFGESGCVGCGRCITWCPVGIDLTAEVETLLRPVTEVAS